MKRIILLLSLAFLPYCLFSQTPIIYDWNHRNIPPEIKSTAYGKFVIFHIKNINTFRYEVKIEGKSIDYVTPIPSELQTIFRLESNTELAGDANDARDGAAEIAGQVASMQNLAKGIPDQVAVPAAKVDPVTKRVTNQGEIDSIQAQNELDKLLVTLAKACGLFADNGQKLAAYKFDLSVLVQASKQHVDYAGMKKLLPGRIARKKMRDNYLQFVEDYYLVETLYAKAKILAEKTGNKLYQDLVEEASEGIEKGYDKVINGDFLKLIEDILTLQTALREKKYFEVYSPPIQVNGDYVVLEIEITPSELNDLMPYDHGKRFKIEIPAKGGTKADFSVGPTISFGDGAKDEIAFLNAQTDTTSLLQQGNNKNAIRPGLAAMMHFYRRTGKDLSFGGVFGAGVGFKAIDDVDLSLYLGGSFVLGKRQKIMLNFGITWQRVDRLKSEFKYEEVYNNNDIDLDTVMDKVFKSAPFISVSYNLTNQVEVE